MYSSNTLGPSNFVETKGGRFRPSIWIHTQVFSKVNPDKADLDTTPRITFLLRDEKNNPEEWICEVDEITQGAIERLKDEPNIMPVDISVVRAIAKLIPMPPSEFYDNTLRQIKINVPVGTVITTTL